MAALNVTVTVCEESSPETVADHVSTVAPVPVTVGKTMSEAVIVEANLVLASVIVATSAAEAG